MISLRTMKIRQKLVLLLLLSGLIPTAVVSVLALITINSQLTQKTKDQLSSIAFKQEQRVSSLLQSKQDETVKVATLAEIQVALGAYFKSGSGAAQTLEGILRSQQRQLADIQAAYITDGQQKVIASTVGDSRGKKFELINDYEAKADKPHAVHMATDPATNTERLYVSTPISANQQTAVLTLAFKADELVAAIQDYTGLDQTGETVVVVKGQDGAQTSLFPLRFDTNAAMTANLKSLELFEHPDTSYGGVRDYKEDKVVVATRTIKAADWMMAVKIDAKEAFSQAAVFRNSLVVIFVVTLLLIVVVALYFTRFFTAPIIALTQKARNIMSGDFRHRFKVESADEVGDLGEAFNRMTDELASSYLALEKRVLERTHDLNAKVAELEDAKTKDEALLESIGDGLIVTDSQGRILLINAIATDLLGLGQPLEVRGQDIDSLSLYDENDTLLPPESRPLQEALQTGKKISQDVRAVQKGGKKVALGITATPVLQQGRLIGAIQIIRDITKEKEVDRMKTEFISVASHQLRTPLSAIKWFTEMLLSGDAGTLQPEQSDFARNIGDSTQRMIELVNSLLNISRIESGRIIVDPKPTDLSQLVSEIINDLKGKTAEKQQNLTISVHHDLPKINLDPRLIRQVYLNLLTNAIKYTPQGGEISVIISRRGEEVISQVSDNGYGIPKAEQAKMFQKFFRASNIAKIETDGTGLGMYLIKSIIESSGGKIWFESEEGKGTTFWFSLPLSGMKAKEGEVTID